MSWTDERVELLKKLWADGLSASQIAAELGGITRNAVIGKVQRLALLDRYLEQLGLGFQLIFVRERRVAAHRRP